MRRNIRWIAGLLLLVLLFTGCQKKTQKPDAEEPQEKFQKAADIYQKAQYAIMGKGPNHYVLTKNAKLKAIFATDPEVLFESWEELWYSKEPYALCHIQSAKMYFGDYEREALLEAYLQKEKGQTVSYIGRNEEHWYREPIEETISEIYFQSYRYDLLPNIDTSLLAVEDQTQELDGKEVYVLNYTIPGREEYPYLKGKEMKKCLDELEINIKLYVETGTYGVVCKEMTITNITGEFAQWLYSTLGTDEEDSFYEEGWKFQEYVLTFRELDYGNVDVPKVPEEGRQKALQNAGLGDV